MGELGIGLYAFSAGNASVEIREYSYFAPPPHASRVDGISHRPADPTNTWLAVCKTALLPLYICDVERLLSNSPITQLSGITSMKNRVSQMPTIISQPWLERRPT